MDTSRELSRTLFTKQEEVLHLLRLSSEILTSSSRDMNTSLLLKECTQANSSIGELSETMKTTKTSVATNFILTLMLIIVFSFTFNYFKDIYCYGYEPNRTSRENSSVKRKPDFLRQVLPPMYPSTQKVIFIKGYISYSIYGLLRYWVFGFGYN